MVVRTLSVVDYAISNYLFCSMSIVQACMLITWVVGVLYPAYLQDRVKQLYFVNNN